MLSLEEMKANRRKWVEALRSGKYEQGRDWLKLGSTYCCLGVLADIAGADKGTMRDSATLGAFPEVMEFVGLRTDCGDFGPTSLAVTNDKGASFSEIADIIESEPKGLFVESAS